MTSIKMVWAEDDRRAIGKNGDLPWNIPSDLKHFKEETINSTMLMGRHTWDAIGRPLPKRKSVVLTSQIDFNPGFDDVVVVHSLDELHQLIDEENKGGQDITVAGGAQLYQALMPIATELSITKVSGDFDGDTFVDEVDTDQFKLMNQQSAIDGDYQLKFLTYQRK